MFDLWRIHERRGELIARAQHPRFAAWWEQLLADAHQRAGETVEVHAVEPEARANELLALAGRAEGLAFAAALTGDESLARAAAAHLAPVIADASPWMGPGHHRHYPELNADLLLAERCKRVAATLSWAGPWLAEAERAEAVAALHGRGGAVIWEDTLRGAWWSNGHNSNWTAVLNSGLAFAALGVAEEHPRDSAAWLARAAEVARTMLDLAAEEGAGVEGLSYWTYCFGSLLDIAEALAGAGDTSLLEHPCWRKAAEFPLYLSLPDLSGWANFGDCGDHGLGASWLFFGLASRAGDRRAQWLANRIAGDPPRVTFRDLVFADPDLPEEPPGDLPPCRLFNTVHLAVLRSDWSPQATQLVLKGGSNAWSHCHLDLNSFILTAGGERLAVDPGPWPYTESYWTSVEPPQSTAWHNTLTVDGGDQRQPPRYRMSYDLEESGNAWCRLSGFVDGSDAAAVEGDATSAYADTLESFVRRVRYLKPDVFVIHDRVRVREVRTQRHLQWLLHASRPLDEVSGGVVVRGEQVDLWVRPLLPDGWAAKLLADRVSPGRPPVHAWALRPTWYHLWNVSPSRSPYPHWDKRGSGRLYGPEYEFLVVIEVAPAGAGPRWTAELGEGVVILRSGGEVRHCRR
ncbi:MAG: heparinase II/III family protein [Armatimonadetes bacterium]|nr:heparinase II/III family protein [Armatimonadota bacterium]